MRSLLRPLYKAPGFTAAALLTLGLGIGLAVAVFTVANALLLRQLPVREQERLVVLWGQIPDRSFDHWPMDLPTAREFARQTRSLERTAWVTYESSHPVPVQEADRVTRLRQSLVSGDFFAVLDTRPALGRALGPEDDVIGAPRVAVLSHSAWQRRFGGDTGVIGRRIELHGQNAAYQVVGVMPPGLEYPRGTDYWAAVVPARVRPGTDTVFAHVDVVGRLGAGSTPEMAREDLEGFFSRNSTAQDRDYRAVVHSIPRLILGDVRPAVIAFSAAAALLLLITCFNVANLLLVRGMVRSREVAVRTALGAPRSRIVLGLLAENAVLALAGGALGVLIALVAVRGFIAFAPAGIPRLDQIGLDLTALGAAVGVTALALLLFGAAPAFTASRIDPAEVVRASVNTGERRSRRGVEMLVAGQVALATLILSAAGLIGRSLLELERADLVLEPSRLLVGELAIPPEQFDSKDEQLGLLDQMMAEIRAVPGVVAVSPMVALPFAGTAGWDGRLASAGQSAEEASKNPVLNMDVVGPEYFSAVGIQVVRGRGFTAEDREGAASVIVVSETAARHFWQGADPIGQRLGFDGSELRWTVVGIVPDTRYRDLRTARPSIYFPLRQSIFPFAPTTLAVRTQGLPEPLVPRIRQAIRTANPAVELVEAATFATHREGPLAQPRLNAILLAGFAIAALVLAGVGLFGVISTMVRQRTRELGVRLALGATESGLSRMVLGRGLMLALGGLAAGAALSLFANRLLQSLLYQVQPTDGVTLAVVALVLVSVALLACLIPARAATRIEPTIALRDA